MRLVSALNPHHLLYGHQAHLQALAATARSAAVLGGVSALIRVAVLFTDYAGLDVVPAHVVYGPFTGTDEGQSRV